MTSNYFKSNAKLYDNCYYYNKTVIKVTYQVYQALWSGCVKKKTATKVFLCVGNKF